MARATGSALYKLFHVTLFILTTLLYHPPIPPHCSELATDACALGKDACDCLYADYLEISQFLRDCNKKPEVVADRKCMWVMLPALVKHQILRDYLDVQSIGRLNTACTSLFMRTDLQGLYKNLNCVSLNRHIYHTKHSVNWVVSRGFSIMHWSMRVAIPSTMTCFQWVCQQLIVKVAEQMLTRQVLDPNKYSHYPGLGEMNPLSLACLQHDYEIIDLLLKSPKLRINSHDKLGRTALHNACLQGSVPMIKKLLEAGANCNTFDEQCCSPLIHAVMFNLREGVALLLQHGAHVHPKNDENLSALDIAQKYVFPSVELVTLLQAADKDSESIKTHLEPQEWPLNCWQAFIMTFVTILSVGLVYLVMKIVTYLGTSICWTNVFAFIMSIDVYSIGVTIKAMFKCSIGFGIGLAIVMTFGRSMINFDVDLARRSYFVNKRYVRRV